jgi:hypothetical protein
MKASFDDVGANNRHQLRLRNTVHVEATRFPAPSDESHGNIGTPWATFLLAFLFPDESLINFYYLASAAHWINANDAHGFANAMAHEPSSLESNAQGAMKLIARNALLGRAHEIHGLKPIVHWHMASLEYGPNFHGERFTALVALVSANSGALTAHLGNAIDCAAVRAGGTVGPYAGFNPGITSGFAMESLGVNYRSRHVGRFLLMNQPYHHVMGTSSIISPSFVYALSFV